MRVQAERAGDRIVLSSERAIAGLKTAIPGAYWSTSRSRWSLPLNIETCLLLRDRFGPRLQVGESLALWYTEEKMRREESHALATSSDAELKLVPERAPLLDAAMKSRPYQRVAARFVADARGRDGRLRALLADTVGLGKTIEALAAVVESGSPGPYLVVAPKTSVETTWIREIQRRLPDHLAVSLPEGRQAREEVLEAFNALDPARMATAWLVTHPAAVRTRSWWICALCGQETAQTARRPEELECGHPFGKPTSRDDHEFTGLFTGAWGAVIADESDQSIIRLKGTPTQTRRGMECLRDLVPPGGVRLAMSGTPFRSRAKLLWSTLNWLDPKSYGGFWRWAETYWPLGGYSGYELGEFREERESMLLDSLNGIMLRRERAQVRSDLPERTYAGAPLVPDDETSPVGIWLNMDPKQEKAYRAIEKEASAEIEGGRLTPTGVLAELTRLKQLASGYGRFAGGEFLISRPSNKYDWILEHLVRIGFPDSPSTKVVIVSQFTRTLHEIGGWLRKDLSTKNHQMLVGYITGDESIKQRDAAIDAFEDLDNPLGLLLLNIKAGGSAITLDAAEEMIFLDETWISDDHEQAEGRIDNRNPERRILPRTYYYLRSLDTIEESIAANNSLAKEFGKRILSRAEALSLLRRS